MKLFNNKLEPITKIIFTIIYRVSEYFLVIMMMIPIRIEFHFLSNLQKIGKPIRTKTSFVFVFFVFSGGKSVHEKWFASGNHKDAGDTRGTQFKAHLQQQQFAHRLLLIY